MNGVHKNLTNHAGNHAINYDLFLISKTLAEQLWNYIKYRPNQYLICFIWTGRSLIIIMEAWDYQLNKRKKRNKERILAG